MKSEPNTEKQCLLGRNPWQAYFFVLNIRGSVLSPSEGFESAFLFAYGWRVVLFPKVVEETIKTLGMEDIS